MKRSQRIPINNFRNRNLFRFHQPINAKFWVFSTAFNISLYLFIVIDIQPDNCQNILFDNWKSTYENVGCCRLGEEKRNVRVCPGGADVRQISTISEWIINVEVYELIRILPEWKIKWINLPCHIHHTLNDWYAESESHLCCGAKPIVLNREKAYLSSFRFNNKSVKGIFEFWISISPYEQRTHGWIFPHTAHRSNSELHIFKIVRVSNQCSVVNAAFTSSFCVCVATGFEFQI